ncbi:hypothetical protein ONQ60_26790, partial [Salmonella enterica subsp. enterica serovar Virginia]|nr:hypothetical protein [Salmonella enterica subsp. enterica serovar Virginia]
MPRAFTEAQAEAMVTIVFSAGAEALDIGAEQRRQLMQQPVVRIGEWLVTPSVNQISRQGRQITLEPRLIDLLMYFAH